MTSQVSGSSEAPGAHPYFPVSPCGPHCLVGDEPKVSMAKRLGRLFTAAGLVLIALIISPSFLVLPGRAREAVVRRSFRSILHAFGVRMEVYGAERLVVVPKERGARGALVVNNHVSWLDIFAINAVQPMRAQAKSDMRSWPVLGWLVAVAGTVWVVRDSLRQLPAAVDELATVLRNGSMVNVTPEGTTWCGLASGHFKPAMFQAAIDGGVPVRPVALRFRMENGRETPAPAFIGDETLIDSVRRVARLRGLVLEVHVLEDIAPGRAADRRELAELAEAAIGSALGRVQLPAQRRRRSVASPHPEPVRDPIDPDSLAAS
ncbi:1-acyl-sn-glycerol-3-phosphate acyltransferase [Herbihabitans rhizosphaerae]|uniref:1-acyl-sn-glycerol-3-phosphate acyltransferase n=1 Tax=Herbihabitans rhizosphaerae TaxID=1872711 RepID=A0A4Q7KTB0_9PSEU|nr:lysophospholipid acyltransferase family protein [Herbihabitans rhizosphaerae]RZS39041.1 1-acyl-sn-glycerol-3-phosphate acyltransferase [Herbihabitans rhizosphaerae]